MYLDTYYLYRYSEKTYGVFLGDQNMTIGRKSQIKQIFKNDEKLNSS